MEAGRLGEVPELHHAARRDRFSQRGEQPGVEPGPRPRAHGEALGLHERLEAGLETLARFGVQQGADLGGKLSEVACPLVDAGTLECLRRRLELRELLGRNADQPVNHVGTQPPMALGVVRLHEFKGTERGLDRVPHAFGGPPADGETGLNVVERQSAGRPLKAHRESHEVLYPYVTHRADCVNIRPGIPE